MARIDMGSKLWAVGVGAVDEVADAMDVRAGRTEPWKRWQDWYRVLGTIGSLAGEVWGMGGTAKMARDVSGPFITLLTKSVATPIRERIASPVLRRSARRGLPLSPGVSGEYRPVETPPPGVPTMAVVTESGYRKIS